MIRFYDNQIKEPEDVEVVMATEHIMFGNDIWIDGKEYFKQNICFDPAVIQLLPVENEKHEIICYAYQDREANRELRMLKELNRNEEAIQFRDVFPDIHNVIVCGCNELSCFFVTYLKKQQINVSVLGKYWDLFGYENNRIVDFEDNLSDSEGNMVVYAEGTQYRADSLFQTVIRSASSWFECIDQIYEVNVVEGKIHDTEGDFADVLEKIREKDVVILGTDIIAQDAYDLLYKYGIDICCFAEFAPSQEGGYGTLLGKEVVGAEELVRSRGDKVFIDGSSQNSTLGAGNVDVYDNYGHRRVGSMDIFDYCGYERNERFFLLRDYIDIPCSCLLHVLKGKRVVLVGDGRLCSLLSDYLMEAEQGNVDTEYTDLSQINMEETGILCMVYQWYGTDGGMWENPTVRAFRKTLSDQNISSYTDYFSSMEALVAIDLFMNRNRNKYTIQQLLPKGILLGRIPPANGNIFLRGVLDGHPDIMQWSYSPLNNNLFFYCIRLAVEKSENILSAFRQLYMEESDVKDDVVFSEVFEESMSNMLSLKKQFTSQELFVLFQIAYAEAMNGESAEPLNGKIIYWEPHGLPRDKFPFLSIWLEDDLINVQTLFMHRDNMVWMGSLCKHTEQNPKLALEELYTSWCMSKEDVVEMDRTSSCMNREEFHVRFEDIKLHPREELMRICDICGIPWSATMLSTTYRGKPWGYDGVYDFDLKSVLNQYEEYLSEFDHFKIALISGPYQKKYGYCYENCMDFTRSELQEIFLKEFRFQQKRRFSNEKDRTAYFLRSYALMQKQLWIARRHAVMDDIVPRFGKVQFENKKTVADNQDRETVVKEIERFVDFVKKQKKLVLYGTGRDCEGLLKRLDETEQSEMQFCDIKAERMEIIFHGKKVLAPQDLCEKFSDYLILVTSSLYYKIIQNQLENMGIRSYRIVCNTIQLWEDEV